MQLVKRAGQDILDAESSSRDEAFSLQYFQALLYQNDVFSPSFCLLFETCMRVRPSQGQLSLVYN